MTDIGEISVAIVANQKDLDAALARVEAAKVRPIEVPVTADTTKTQASLQAAEAKALSFAQSIAALATRTGDYAQAERTLTGALSATTATTTRTLAAQRQLLGVQQQAAAAVQRSAAAAAKAQRDIITLAQAEARLAQASGDGARAQEILSRAIAQVGGNSRAALGAQTQLANLQRTAQGSAQGAQTLTGALGGLNTALGAVGLGVGVSTVVQFGAAALQSANQLEKTQATLRAVAGSTDVYNQALTIAQANQRQFGGTLNDNLAPMQQFLFIANRSGASLNELNQAAQLLSTINPAEGFQGAGVALSEFFSGDITSLAERFNLPRAALRDLTAEGVTAQQKLAGLEQLLAAQGVTAATLAASLNTTAATYDQLGANVSNLTTQLGGLISAGLEPAALGAARVAAGASELVAVLTGGAGQISAAQASLAATAGTYEEYVAAAREAQGAAQDAADGFTAQFGPLAGLAGALAGAVTGTAILTEAEFQAAQAAAAQAEAQTAAGVAATDTGAATQTAAQAAAEDALAKLEQEAAAARSAAAHDALKAAIEQAANSSTPARAAAAAIAKALGVEEGRVLALINAHRELNVARKGGSGAAQFGGGGRRAGGLVGDDDSVRGVSPKEAAEQAAAARERTAKREAAVQAALREQTLATGSAAEVAALRQTQYNEAVRQYGAASAEAIRAQTSLMQAQERAAKPTGGGGGGGKSPKVTAAEKEAQQIAKAEETYRKAALTADRNHQEAVLDAEEAYQKRRLDIAAEFAAKRAAAEQSFANKQVSDRSSFYQSLASVDKSQRTAMIQEYEAAQAKAAEIAGSQGAAAGEAYLAEITGIIRERAERAAAIAKALEEGDKAEAKFLQDIDAMARAEEERRLGQAVAGADTGAAEQAAIADADAKRAADLAAAEERRQEALGSAAERAGDAQATAQQRAALAAATTNSAYTDQLALLQQIQQTGGAPAPTAPTTGQPAASAPAIAPPAPGAGQGPIPVTDAGLAALGEKLDRVARELASLKQRGAMSNA